MTGFTVEVADYFVWLFWMLLSMTSFHLPNPKLKKILPSVETLEKLLNASGVVVVTGVLEALKAATPPTVAWFKALPSTVTDCWAVYVLVLEKPGHRPRIYIGSGTQYLRGVAQRWSDYDSGLLLPVRVHNSLVNEGFIMTYKGILCSSPIPPWGSKFALRGLFLLMEAAFANAFWTMEDRTKDYGMPNLCPWSIESLEYDGLCSHSSISEGIRGEEKGLDNAQVFVTREQVKQRRADQLQANYYDFKALDYEGWKATRRRYNAVSLPKMYSTNRATGKFKCDACNMPLSGKAQLEVHKQSRAHKDKVNGITRVAKRPSHKVWMDKNRAAGKFVCTPCGFNGATKQQHTVHLNSERHLAKLAALETAASGS